MAVLDVLRERLVGRGWGRMQLETLPPLRAVKIGGRVRQLCSRRCRRLHLGTRVILADDCGKLLLRCQRAFMNNPG